MTVDEMTPLISEIKNQINDKQILRCKVYKFGNYDIFGMSDGVYHIKIFFNGGYHFTFFQWNEKEIKITDLYIHNKYLKSDDTYLDFKTTTKEILLEKIKSILEHIYLIILEWNKILKIKYRNKCISELEKDFEP